MKKLFLVLITFALIAYSTNAQESLGKGFISGKLIDELTDEPVAEANIRVLTQKDSLFVTGKASEKDGSFSIPIQYGTYLVHISYLGYADIIKEAIVNSKKPSQKLGTILLQSNDILLSDAVITAIAPEVVLRGDTVEYNADYYKVPESAVLEDLLKKMPDVEISEDGKITINGKEVKKILVDGKEFFSDDPKVASKNLPAKMIARLQILDQKTDLSQMSGFDDGEEETVLNLIVKPGMKSGTFGSSYAGYGSEDRYEANVSLRYMREKDQLTFIGALNNTNNEGFTDNASAMFDEMGGRGGRGGDRKGITKSRNIGLNFNNELTEKLTINGNIRYGDTDNNRISKVYTQNIISSKNTFEKENNQSSNYSQNVNMDVRLEWKPDTMTKFIFRPTASFYNNKRDEGGNFITTGAESDTINYGDSKYSSEGKGKNIGGTLQGSRQLWKKGRVISFNIGGGLNESENNGSNMSNTFYSSSRKDNIIDQRFNSTNSSRNMRAQISYVEPLGKNNFLQIAYNYRFNRSESDKDTRTQDEKGEYTVFSKRYSKRLENNFSNQDININFRASRKKYNYMLGLSLQPSKSESQTFIGDSLANHIPQSVVNFAPVAQYNYLWSKQNNLRINYNGKTTQPTIRQLSSVVDISDPLNTSYGNADLKPTFNHNLSIRYRNSNPKKNQSYMFQSNTGFTTNDIERSRITDKETGKKESTFVNVNGNWHANGRFTTNQPLFSKKLSLNSTSFASFNVSNGLSNGEENKSKRLNLREVLGLNYRSDEFDFSIKGNVSYNKVDNSLPGQQNQEYFNYGGSAQTLIFLPFDFILESDINYATNSGYADGFKQNELLWNGSISKLFFQQKNGTIRFKIYDILQQKSDLNRSVTANFIRDTNNNTLTSYFMFHFVYRFNIFSGGTSKGNKKADRNAGKSQKGKRS